MKREISLNEMRKLQIEILDYVHNFCVNHNIKYSLSGGTLIGAVRHKGFIPWDDDVDIQFLRSEYEKFVSEWIKYKHPYILHSVETNAGSYMPFGKISNPKTILEENYKSHMGINIDLFPLDNVIDEEDFKRRYTKIAALHKKYLVPLSQAWGHRTLKSFIRYFLRRISIFPMTRNKASKMIDKIAREKNECQCEFVFVLTFGTGGEKIKLIPRTCYNDYTSVLFEGKEYMAMKGYHQYLTNTFGNYMELPPEEKRVSYHYFKAWWR